MEEWRPVVGYEKEYLVSNIGNVISLNFCRSGKSRKLKKILNSCGYYVVTLYKDKTPKPTLIHRLVASAFIPNPENNPVVDHIDANPLNNHISNLRWTTIKGNVNNKISRRRRNESIRKRFLGKTGVDSATYRGVYQIDPNGEIVNKWDCISDAWRETGIRVDSIVRCCQSDYIHAGHFIWIYTEDYNQDEVIKRVTAYNKPHSHILQYTIDGVLLKEWKSAREIQDSTGLNMGSVKACCRNERKTSHGYVWRLKHS